MKIQFLGAADTVTGSKYRVSAGATDVLIDCGLFQGLKQLRLRNRAALPFEPSALAAVVLTHAHLDHSGYLPLLVKNGFRGPIHCTPATYELCKVLLPDSGRLQEEDADYANRHGLSKHAPALPLYTEDDAMRCLRRFDTVEMDRPFALGSALQAQFAPAGHILGAAFVALDDGVRRTVFSGDVGRPHDPVMLAPRALPACDHLVLESTYGDRVHPALDPCDELEPIVNRTVRRGGVLVVPSFAVGRVQLLLHLIQRLKHEGRIARDLPVYLNSPMAMDVTDLYLRFPGGHRLDPAATRAMCRTAHYVTSVEESKALNRGRHPMILIAGSGMATGGRVIHHLKAFAPDERNTILLVGYQAAGTRGAALLAGAKTLRIHGADVAVHAEVASLAGMSAHADSAELLQWIGQLPTPPRCTFITHGEPTAQDGLRQRIERGLRWNTHIPAQGETVDLDAAG